MKLIVFIERSILYIVIELLYVTLQNLGMLGTDSINVTAQTAKKHKIFLKHFHTVKKML